jgi:hypothetical protein
MDFSSPPYQLLDGWYAPDGDFRWTQPDSRAILMKPEASRHFEVVACVTPEQILRYQAVALRVMVDTQTIGRHEFTAPGCETVAWPTPLGPAGQVRVEFHSTPPYRDSAGDTRIFGISIKGFGFTAQ